MREILFRGKSVDTGKWIEGFYCGENCEHPFSRNMVKKPYIIHKGTGFWFEVIPETVGQFTGLTDKNGKRIFEGDVVRYTRTNMYAPECSFREKDLVSVHLVSWDDSASAFIQNTYDLNKKRITSKGSAVLYDDRAKENIIEIIGNIHDNPELLEGGTNEL